MQLLFTKQEISSEWYLQLDVNSGFQVCNPHSFGNRFPFSLILCCMK